MSEEELIELGKIAATLFKDVQERLDYNPRKVNLLPMPKLPISLVVHYNYILTPHKHTLEKFLKFLEKSPIS